jgi:hypothetical protein
MTTAAPRRQLSPRAQQALAEGRQRRAQQLAASREQSPTQAQPEPSEQTLAELISESPKATAAPSSPPSPSEPLNGSSLGSDGLRIAFDATLPAEREKPGKRPAVKRAAPAPRSSSDSSGTSLPKSGLAKGQAKPAPWVNEREERIRYQAERDAPTLAKTLIAAAGWLIDKQAAPSEELADDMAQPALRLLYRHFPSLMELSPDAKDGGELIMATLIWSEQVAQFRKQQRYSRGESRVTRAPITSFPSANYPPATANGRGSQPAYEAGGGGYHPGADTGAADRLRQGSADTWRGAASETQSFAELGIDLG